MAFVALAAGVSGALVAAAAPSPADGSTAKHSTKFAFRSYAFGTRVKGGSSPASSGKSAYALISCTNLVGQNHTNEVDSSDLGGGVVVGVNKSRARSWRSHRHYHVTARNKISSLTAGTAPGPQLFITGLKTKAHVWHNAKGYHGQTTHYGILEFALAGQDPQPIPFPNEGQTETLPGLGSITGGFTSIHKDSKHASAFGYALKLHMDQSNSDIKIGRVYAVLEKAAPGGVLHGRAYGAEVDSSNDAVRSGPTALQPLPCIGTGGQVRKNKTASFTLPGAGNGGLTVDKVRGTSHKHGSTDAWTRSTVATFDLGGGQALFQGIYANAHAHKTAGGRVTRDWKGTTPGSITVNGQTNPLPRKGSYEIPGVATVTTGVVKKSRTGIRVTAVRIALSGVDTVINLGNAKARISRH